MSSLANLIQLLPDAIANQIAAGEVVQRPASVIKELLENAIDAGATEIQVFVKDAGKALIQVIDNGTGMSDVDARMSFERHATSKIRKADDLFSLTTMGFRGEALASIAAVAQVELKTRRNEDALGQHIAIEGSSLKFHERTSCLVGTSISVKNLFFNVPARRNFLKSNNVEVSHILDEFKHVALAHPDIKFTLFNNETEVYTLWPGKLHARIVGFFGKSFREVLTACEEITPFLTVRGYIGKPSIAKRTRGDQYLFVNSRFVKHHIINHAIQTAFETSLPQGYHAFYVLFLEIDPKHIDINIHPTKTEIKFDDEKTVYGLVQAAVRKSIGLYNLTPSLDFETSIKFTNILTETSTSSRSLADKSYGHDFKDTNLKNWESLFTKPSGVNVIDRSEDPVLFSSAPLLKTEPDEGRFQIGSEVIVARWNQDLLLVNQKAAFERIYFEKYTKQKLNRSGVSQTLLFTKILDLSTEQAIILSEIKDDLAALGFSFDLRKNELEVTGVPADSQDQENLILDLLDQVKRFEHHQELDKPTYICLTLAKKNAAKQTKSLAPLEIRQLLEQLMATSMPSSSPSGQTILKRLNTFEILELIQ